MLDGVTLPLAESGQIFMQVKKRTEMQDTAESSRLRDVRRASAFWAMAIMSKKQRYVF